MRNPGDISKGQQEYYERIAENTCHCGHTKEQHNDTGGCADLMEGACSYCSCRKFLSVVHNPAAPSVQAKGGE